LAFVVLCRCTLKAQPKSVVSTLQNGPGVTLLWEIFEEGRPAWEDLFDARNQILPKLFPFVRREVLKM
jgi:hypothetical protein